MVYWPYRYLDDHVWLFVKFVSLYDKHIKIHLFPVSLKQSSAHWIDEGSNRDWSEKRGLNIMKPYWPTDLAVLFYIIPYSDRSRIAECSILLNSRICSYQKITLTHHAMFLFPLTLQNSELVSSNQQVINFEAFEVCSMKAKICN